MLRGILHKWVDRYEEMINVYTNIIDKSHIDDVIEKPCDYGMYLVEFDINRELI